MKVCTKCGIEKPLEDYYKGRGSCKICRKKVNREWYRNNSEKIKELSREWSRNNPEKVRQNSKKWSINNPDKVRQYSREWSRNNPEKGREWRKNNLALMRLFRYKHDYNLKTIEQLTLFLSQRLLKLFERGAITGKEAKYYLENLHKKEIQEKLFTYNLR